MGVVNWVRMNWDTILTVVGVTLTVASSLKQGLERFPTAAKWLDVLIDVLSIFPRKGQRGVLGKMNVPGVPSLPPKTERKDDDDNDQGGTPVARIPLARVIRAAMFVGFILPVVVLSGCGTTKAQWRAAGIDVAKCLHPAVVDAASDAIVAYLDTVSASVTPDYVNVGKTIAAKYGPDVALCAIGKIWANLSGDGAVIKGKPTPVYAATAYLVNHQDEWVYPVSK